MAGRCLPASAARAGLATILASGSYLTQIVDTFAAAVGKKGTPGRSGGTSTESVEDAISAMQLHIADFTKDTNALMRQAGIQKQAQGVFLGEHPWKTDDAAWFKAHPERSHRLRQVLKGEAEMVAASIPKGQTPPNHRVDILVRQVEPGKRIRAAFTRDIETDIPD